MSHISTERKEETAKNREGRRRRVCVSAASTTTRAGGWRLHLALRCRRTVATAGVRLEERTRPKERTSVSIGSEPPPRVEYRRPATGPGVKTRVRTNKVQPRHKSFKPRPHPEKKKKEKLLALWLCTVTSCGDSSMSTFPRACRTG